MQALREGILRLVEIQLSRPQILVRHKEALIAQLEALKKNPYTFAPLIIATEERLLAVLSLQIQQV